MNRILGRGFHGVSTSIAAIFVNTCLVAGHVYGIVWADIHTGAASRVLFLLNPNGSLKHIAVLCFLPVFFPICFGFSKSSVGSL